MKSSMRSMSVLCTAIAALGLTGCASDDDTASSTTEMAASSTSPGGDPAAELVGPGCAAYAAQVPDGPGSVTGMSAASLSVAASNNPLLTTLTAAVSGQLNPEVNLVETLDSGEFTVLAPVDDAFAKIEPATIDSLRTDSATLSKILTYHVIPGQIDQADLDGTQTTVEGGTVEVTGSGDNLKVNDAAVICGGVTTANATVYLIDTVLMPPAG